MKVPYKWLLDYVDLEGNIIDNADALTMSGSKVEEVIISGKEIDKVVTGKLIKCEKHPDSDHLTICQVDVKDEVIQIITGADNIKEGDIVPVAKHGSTLPGGVKIKKGKLRGLESNGMLCSEAELGIASEESVHGIMILSPDTEIGRDIKEILGLDGGTIDFEITSNRADCFCVYGIAREAAATFKKRLKPLELSFSETDGDIHDYLSVEVKDSLCRRYMAKMVKNVKIKQSPEWMQQRLMDAGVRPINNIVDITNYVMIELGQPLHAFDFRFIGGKKIIVRRALENENFKTLDGVDRKLSSNMLVIADEDKAVAVAGVMGGENSEIKEDTNTIIIEFANFDGVNTRITSKKLGLRTEASSRFEKDIDPNLIETAMRRACNLIQATDSGDIVGGVIDIYEKPLQPHIVKVEPTWINKFLGTNISISEMKEIFESIEMKVYGEEEFTIEVPTFRQDVKIKEDAAEEIARIYGYNNIPTERIKGEAVEAYKTRDQKLREVVRQTMLSFGIYESMSYTFASPKVFDKINLKNDDELRKNVVILNPLGEDFSTLRTTTLPSILDSLSINYSRDNEDVSLFEIARVYRPKGEILPEEKDMLTIGMYGKVDFYDIKGLIEGVLGTLGIEKYSFIEEVNNPSFHPGRCARLLIKNRDAGIIGQVHPDVLDNYGIETLVYAAEIDLDVLFNEAKMDKKFKHLPKFPAMIRDLALLVKEEVKVAEIEDIIKRNGKGILESYKLFDIYRGKQVPEGYKSIAYTITYRNENRTLKDEEVSKVQETIIKNLEEKLSAKLR